MPKRKAEQPPEDQNVEEEEQELSEEGEDHEEGQGGSEEEEDSQRSSDEEEDDDDDDDTDDLDESEDGAEDPNDKEDGEDFKEVNVDFQCVSPEEEDFQGLRALLHNYLDGGVFNVSQLIDTIIQQAPLVGSVIRAGEEDDDPIAVLSVLAPAKHRSLQCWSQITDFITTSCSDRLLVHNLATALRQDSTALIVSERLINCPPQLAPPFVKVFFEEVTSLAADPDADPADRAAYSFTHYLLLTRVYLDNNPGSNAGAERARKGGKGKGKEGGAAQSAAPVTVYVRPEDEFLHQVCSWSFMIPVTNRPVARDELVPQRLVMLVAADKVAAAQQQLAAVVGSCATP